mmetsp:Transcript_12706/g.27045  ORF Transcript_12706/g.27045 Transcript_12706/m.27045 type:complete len:668 (+) Transcript_12706:37-2040(+)|eukprot:CAMPEP_0183733676 /NCGR_PEP_ID=MMETSP0737-20130205/41693_1 /TAXON_ID=385413 /ORGANISM="Thalassiosira miniscula, Strain CCMP1093" /LENGTH=667 /DNA_ID=CAMNT_0025966971 /DNA_START=26 /DNA_END=2029 /DNA_ORIENTATION=-
MSSRHKGEALWLSFAAGALSASLVWSIGWAARHVLFSRKRQLWFDDGDESDSDGYSDDASDETDSFPQRKASTRWPWDKLREKVLSASASFLNLDVEDAKDVSVTADDKTGPCIGEIFGLDVGGTLTKLVYFEQQIQEYKRQGSHEGLHRREHYNVAASALEVLQARRSSIHPIRHNSNSDNDLQGLWGLRQESVPDRLDEFASSCNITDTDSSLPAKIASPNGHSESKQPDASTGIGMKKSRSMINLSKSTEHAEALDNFYSFARRLDTYETALKDKHLSYYSRFLNGTFHFIRFETRRMSHATNLMRYSQLHLNIKEMGATGGGAHKFADDWERELGIKMAKQDEMDSLVAGMQFVMADIIGECYTFKPNNWTPNGYNLDEYVDESEDSDPKESLTRDASSSSEANRPRVDEWWTSKKVQRDNVVAAEMYPYLLVSIGTGVSILRVDGPRKQERISGSTIGGGTYWGLCRLLTGSDSFRDVLDLAMKGDPSKVDMMVGDIYGKNSSALEKVGLPSDIVASSFGKLVAKQNPSEGIKEEDLARALLLMVTNNIGQVAHLNAKLHKTSRIYFVGTFLQHNVISQQRLAYSIDYWSQGKMEAQFLEHEGYFGALGAFLLNQGIEHDSLNRKGNINAPDSTPERGKKRRMKGKFHKRSKSLGSISLHSG